MQRFAVDAARLRGVRRRVAVSPGAGRRCARRTGHRGATAPHRRRIRRRQRPRPRARRRDPLVRGAPHPDRSGRRHQHGRPRRRRVRLRPVVGGAGAACSRTPTGTRCSAALPFRYKNVRRKQDARAYPSRLEFGLKRGIAPPARAQQRSAGRLLPRAHRRRLRRRFAASTICPTPFRAVAVDLVSAQQVVLDHGSLADAMRATMSLPGVFPPVEIEGRVLVDGGAMNNVPADVVRSMGADVVIAVNVGFMGDTRTVNYSLFGLMGQTVDVMMQANTRAVMRAADIVINPPLEDFGSLDWRRSAELADEGYRAAEAMKDRLLPLALDEAGWVAYQDGRQRAAEDDASRAAVPVGRRARSHRTSVASRTPCAHGSDSRSTSRRSRRISRRSEASIATRPSVGGSCDDAGRSGLQVSARPKAQRAAVPDARSQSSEHDQRSNSRSSSPLATSASTSRAPDPNCESTAPSARSQPLAPSCIARSAGRRSLRRSRQASSQQTTKFIQDDVVVAQYDAVRAQRRRRRGRQSRARRRGARGGVVRAAERVGGRRRSGAAGARRRRDAWRVCAGCTTVRTARSFPRAGAAQRRHDRPYARRARRASRTSPPNVRTTT